MRLFSKFREYTWKLFWKLVNLKMSVIICFLFISISSILKFFQTIRACKLSFLIIQFWRFFKSLQTWSNVSDFQFMVVYFQIYLIRACQANITQVFQPCKLPIAHKFVIYLFPYIYEFFWRNDSQNSHSSAKFSVNWSLQAQTHFAKSKFFRTFLL